MGSSSRRNFNVAICTPPVIHYIGVTMKISATATATSPRSLTARVKLPSTSASSNGHPNGLHRKYLGFRANSNFWHFFRILNKNITQSLFPATFHINCTARLACTTLPMNIPDITSNSSKYLHDLTKVFF